MFSLGFFCFRQAIFATIIVADFQGCYRVSVASVTAANDDTGFTEAFRFHTPLTSETGDSRSFALARGTCDPTDICSTASSISLLSKNVTLPVCKDTQEVQMSDDKEVKLVGPKSLMVVLWVAAIGLLLNGAQPFLSSPANAVGGVQKIAICNSDGQICASVYNSKRQNKYRWNRS